jgi:hypothetical protein
MSYGKLLAVTESNIATKQSTVAALLDAAKRDHLPLAHSFLQTKTRSGSPRPSVLSLFVGASAERSLAQYLLFHAAASGTDFGVARDSRIWARALGLDHTLTTSRTAVSKNWGWLARHHLVRRERRGRLSKVVLLRDDGSGRAYKHPRKLNELYLRLPFSYWSDEWDTKLDLPSIAILLIALSLGDGFILPHSQIKNWYGLSSSTLTNGIGGLRRHGLLDVRRDKKEAPLAPEGFTWEYSYTLKSPFGPKGARSSAASRRGTNVAGKAKRD